MIEISNHSNVRIFSYSNSLVVLLCRIVFTRCIDGLSVAVEGLGPAVLNDIFDIVNIRSARAIRSEIIRILCTEKKNRKIREKTSTSYVVLVGVGILCAHRDDNILSFIVERKNNPRTRPREIRESRLDRKTVLFGRVHFRPTLLKRGGFTENDRKSDGV